jgi:putative FmdB family regulatory protein
VPTYQYACTACGHRFDAVQSFSDSSLTDCPECAGRLRKVFSSVGIVFKGSGFYRTDSRSGGSGTDSGKEKVAAGASTSSDSGDSKGSSGSESTTKKADSGSSSTPTSASSAPAAAASA